MRKQKGQILISRGSWAVRWRQSTTDATGATIKKRCFKILGPVLPEHRRNRNRIPEEIKAKAASLLEPLNAGTATTVLTTIGELVETYLKYKHLKPSTSEGYTNIWNRYLQNRIADKTIGDFRIVDAHRLWQQIHAANQKLSRQTMAHIKFFLLGVFKYAINNGFYFGINPATADLPEGLPGRKATQAYTFEEITRLISLLASPLAQAVVAFAWGTGLRKGELAGVRWEDMEGSDTGAVFHIRRSVWNGQVVTPKTESSADDVHIDNSVLSYLEAYRAFAGGVKEGYVFGYDAEHPINLSSFARWQLKPVMKKADMTWKGWHGFRRGASTHLARQMSSNGAEAAALVLRHSHVSTTIDHYIKTTKQERRAQEAGKVVEIAKKRKSAAAVLGDGLKQQAVN